MKNKKFRNCFLAISLTITISVFGIDHPCEVKANPAIVAYAYCVGEIVALLLADAGVTGLDVKKNQQLSDALATAYQNEMKMNVGVILNQNVFSITTDALSFFKTNIKYYHDAGEIGLVVKPSAIADVSCPVPYGQTNVNTYEFNGYGVYQITIKNGNNPTPVFDCFNPSWTTPGNCFSYGEPITKSGYVGVRDVTNSYSIRNLKYNNSTFYVYVYPSGFQTSSTGNWPQPSYCNTVSRYTINVFPTLTNMFTNSTCSYGQSVDIYNDIAELYSNTKSSVKLSLSDSSSFDIIKVRDYGFDDWTPEVTISGYDSTKVDSVTGVKVNSSATETDVSNVITSGAVSADSSGVIDVSGTGTTTNTSDYTGVLNNILTHITSGTTDLINAINTALTGVAADVSSIATSISNAFNPPDDVNLDWSPIKVAGETIASKFPFCIPFDLVNSIKALNVESSPPHWQINFPSQYFVGGGTIDIDFSQFETWAKVIRWGITIIFTVSLILITRKMIGSE